MIVVDTSVWVDLLRRRRTPRAERARDLIRRHVPIASTDAVLAEVLQGARNEPDAAELERRLAQFPILQLRGLADFRLAAQLYRTARAAGLTPSSTIDLLIAAVCVREDIPILHADTDFDRLASCTPLRVFE